jgi:hypothetical protein
MYHERPSITGNTETRQKVRTRWSIMRNSLHGLEYSLTRQQFLIWCRYSQHYTHPQGSWSCSQQPITYPSPESYKRRQRHISLRYVLILSFHLFLGFLSGLIPLEFIILLIFCEKQKPWTSSLQNFLQPHVISSLLCPSVGRDNAVGIATH